MNRELPNGAKPIQFTPDGWVIVKVHSDFAPPRLKFVHLSRGKVSACTDPMTPHNKPWILLTLEVIKRKLAARPADNPRQRVIWVVTDGDRYFRMGNPHRTIRRGGKRIVEPLLDLHQDMLPMLQTFVGRLLTGS